MSYLNSNNNQNVTNTVVVRTSFVLGDQFVTNDAKLISLIQHILNSSNIIDDYIQPDILSSARYIYMSRKKLARICLYISELTTNDIWIADYAVENYKCIEKCEAAKRMVYVEQSNYILELLYEAYKLFSMALTYSVLSKEKIIIGSFYVTETEETK